MTATVEADTRGTSVPCPLDRCGAQAGQECRTTTDSGRDPLGRTREPHLIRLARVALAEQAAQAELESCDACGAEPGESCRPGCLGYALAMGEL